MRNIRRILGPASLAAGVIALVATSVGAQRPQHRADDGNALDAAGRDQKETRISQQQMENLEARIATATAIVSRLEREAKARGLASGWRQATLETLLPLSLDGLRQVEQQAFSLDGLTAATRAVNLEARAAAARDAADDPGALGDPNKDLTYVPLAPCRFIDTRNVGGKIAGVRGFDVDSVGSTYGGDGVCHPVALLSAFPSNSDQIAALAMNVTLFDTSTAVAPGFVAMKPAAASPITSLLNWYDQGPTVQVANQGIVTLDQSGGAGSVDEFVIQTSGPVHIIVDIFGGFIAPVSAALKTIQVFDSVVVPNLAAGTLESPVCPAGYALTGGGCFTGDFGHYLSLSYPGGGDNRWACRSHNVTGIDSVLFARAICSQTPGR